MSTNWRDALKEGDAVVAETTGFAARLAVVRVEKATAAYITVQGVKYRRDTGRPVGARTWDRNRIAEATPERIAEAREFSRRTRALARVLGTDWRKLPTDTLEAVAALLPPE